MNRDPTPWRRMFIPGLRMLTVVGLLIGGANPLAGQLKPLTATVDVRIEPEVANLTAIGALLIDRSGNAVVTQPEDNVIRLFKSDGTSTSFGRAGSGPGEFRRLWYAGWLGDTLWVTDGALGRITLIGPTKQLIRSLPFPSRLNTKEVAGPERSGLVGTVPQAMLAKGAMLVKGYFATAAPRPAWAQGPFPRSNPVFLVDASGKVSRIVAWSREEECLKNYSIGARGSGYMTTPFCTAPQLRVSPDGSLLVLVAADTASATFKITLLTTSGDTIYARDFPYDPVPVTPQLADSARASELARARNGPPEKLALIRSMTYPGARSPFRDIVVGSDGTVWVERRTKESDAHSWMAIDKKGKPLGTLSLPGNVTLRAASGEYLWASTASEVDELGLVRYRLSPRGR